MQIASALLVPHRSMDVGMFVLCHPLLRWHRFQVSMASQILSSRILQSQTHHCGLRRIRLTCPNIGYTAQRSHFGGVLCCRLRLFAAQVCADLTFSLSSSARVPNLSDHAKPSSAQPEVQSRVSFPGSLTRLCLLVVPGKDSCMFLVASVYPQVTSEESD